MKTSTSMLAMATLVVAQAGLSGPSKAFDLDGAWTGQADLCKKIFSKTGNKTSFAPGSDLYGSGFIAEGNTIRGQAAKCTVKTKKEDGAVTHLAATCETGIMVDQFQLSFKVIDDNKIIRLYPEMNALETTYIRCPLAE
jgi:hypothetical protein